MKKKNTVAINFISLKYKNKISIYFIMGIFDELFPEYELSTDEEDYDPYDTTGKYGQYGTCNRGVNYSSTGWCCMDCERDRMRRRKQYNKIRNDCMKNGNFNFSCSYDINNTKFFDSDNCFNDFRYVFVDEDPILEIENDWKILGLVPPKTKEQIKKKYRKLCLKHHPDKGGNSQDFIKITDSYNTLCSVC